MSPCLARRTLGWNYPLGDGLPLFTELPRREILGNWGIKKGRGVENPDRKVGLVLYRRGEIILPAQ